MRFHSALHHGMTAGVYHDVNETGGYGFQPLIAYPLIITVGIAYLCGFMDMFTHHDFERLHIFLLNLCAGGTIILYYTEGRYLPSRNIKAFYLLSLLFAASAFLKLYVFTVILAPVLGLIVERIRRHRFAAFPVEFFTGDRDVSLMFQQAALLCLSTALFLSMAVVINDTWIHLFYYQKLTLNVFFLGFSFPVSLMTFSLLFSCMGDNRLRGVRITGFVLFWIITCGVMVFFVFIILELKKAQMITAVILAVAVTVLFIIYVKQGKSLRQKRFLLSGMIFLLITAVTGVMYIIMPRMGVTDIPLRMSLRIHAFMSLYGWNMTGIFLMLRYGSMPGRIRSGIIILFHWILIGVLSPLARLVPLMAIPASMAWFIFLVRLFMPHRHGRPAAAPNNN